MRISLFSQSLFALPLDRAIPATAEAGYHTIELACRAPHFDRRRARTKKTVELVKNAGLEVSALSLFNKFTEPALLDEEVEDAKEYIRFAPEFGTGIVKLTPGPPASADAKKSHWDTLKNAIEELLPAAEKADVRLAFETHMSQLTDTVKSSKKFLGLIDSERVGLTVDFTNLKYAGDDPVKAIRTFRDRIFHVHVKNGAVDDNGTLRFGPLGEGMTDWPKVIAGLKKAAYDGFLSIECLQPMAQNQPGEIARRDLDTLWRMLSDAGLDPEE